MKTTLIPSLAAFAVLSNVAWSLEEDRKQFGAMDGHAVMVYGVLQQMDLPDETLVKLRTVATKSQLAWRGWFVKHRAKVDRFQAEIKKLKEKGDRAELKNVLADKKRFMHTAPSLLRNPEPIGKVLSDAQYTTFLAKLDILKKSLHNPKDKGRPKDALKPETDAVTP